MTDKQLNKAICKELQKVAASFFNDVSDNLKGFGNSFTTYDLCGLSRDNPTLFGICTDIIDVKTVDFWGNESSGIGIQTLTGKKQTVCVGDFKCTFDLSNVFEFLRKFEKLLGTKIMVFVIEEEKNAPSHPYMGSLAKCQEEGPGGIKEEVTAVDEPEDMPYYRDITCDIPDVETTTIAPVRLEAPVVQVPGRTQTVFASERPFSVLEPERPHSIPFVLRCFLITNKRMNYLIA